MCNLGNDNVETIGQLLLPTLPTNLLHISKLTHRYPGSQIKQGVHQALKLGNSPANWALTLVAAVDRMPLSSPEWKPFPDRYPGSLSLLPWIGVPYWKKNKQTNKYFLFLLLKMWPSSRWYIAWSMILEYDNLSNIHCESEILKLSQYGHF